MNNSDKIIGIPRAISFYNNYPFYYGFFNELGIEIVLSDKTTSKLINDGTKYVAAETCLPVKVFVGHVINLIEKGVKNIFVPSLQSTGYKINNCSKIRALPEIIRNVINEPINIIEPEINKTENIGLSDFCNDIAASFNIYDKKLIKRAINAGWRKYNSFIELSQNGCSFNTALDYALEGRTLHFKSEKVNPLSVVIMGHGYNLFDERVSLNLLKKLENLGVNVYTSLNVSKNDALESIHKLGEIQYWANELDLTGTAAYYLLNGKIDGIIALSAFGCGPDSLMVDEIQFHAAKKDIPMLHLNIDEHTGEAGFITRIEAFTDMMLRKKRRILMQNNTFESKTNNNEISANKLTEKVVSK